METYGSALSLENFILCTYHAVAFPINWRYWLSIQRDFWIPPGCSGLDIGVRESHWRYCQDVSGTVSTWWTTVPVKMLLPFHQRDQNAGLAFSSALEHFPNVPEALGLISSTSPPPLPKQTKKSERPQPALQSLSCMMSTDEALRATLHHFCRRRTTLSRQDRSL